MPTTNTRLTESAASETAENQADIRQLTSLDQGGARAAMVNRTHRVVHERAKNLQAQRSRARSLWVPLLVSSALVLILCTAIWTVLVEYIPEYAVSPIGIPESSQQFLVLLLWFLPLSAALLAMVWFRRTRGQRERGDEEQAG